MGMWGKDYREMGGYFCNKKWGVSYKKKGRLSGAAARTGSLM